MSKIILFNDRSTGSYHPWNSRVLGEAYGEMELDKIIPIKDYLDLPPSTDDFIYGVIKGKKKLAEEKARQAANKKGKDPLGDVAKNILKDK